ncbi:MAG: two-component system sensor histidine kinase NtrB [Bacillota bacterium]
MSPGFSSYEVLLQVRFNQVLGAMGSAILLTNDRGMITFVNSAAEKLLQLSISDLLGNPITIINAPWTPFLKTFAAQTAKGQMEPLGEGAQRRWVDWHVYPLLEDDQPAGWLVVVDDRTDYYHWQEVTRRAERFAITATMVGALAHELRNPLAAAKGMMQLMGRKKDPKQVTGYVDLVTRELDRVTQLLNEFLLLGRPAEIAAEPLNLLGLLQEALPLLEAEAYSSGAEIIAEFEEVPPVMADSGQIMQVVLNLVRNAIEAAGEQGKIQLNLRNLNNRFLFEVKDNGPGLSPEIFQKIFEPFFTTKERGTGLGLPVSQAIVHNHGGTISASNHKCGAVFTVELPALPVRLGQSKDVLICLTNEIERYTVEQTLRVAGFTISCAKPDSCNLTEDFSPSVVLLDETCCVQNIDHICKTWPEAKIAVIGESNGLPVIPGLEFMRRPLDYAYLISRLAAMLK